MLKEGKMVFDEKKDKSFIIPESVGSFNPIMYKRLYQNICEKGKLEFERTKSKDEVLRVIHGLLELGQKLGHDITPSDKMIEYFERNFDIQCLVEYVNRVRRTNMNIERHHDYRYIEQDLPLASDEEVDKISNSVTEWGKIEDEIALENEHKKGI